MKKKHRVSIQNKRFQLRIVSPCHKDYDIYLVTISKTYAMEMLSQYSSLGFQCELSKFNLKSSKHYLQENDCVTEFFIDNRLSMNIPLLDEFRALHGDWRKHLILIYMISIMRQILQCDPC